MQSMLLMPLMRSTPGFWISEKHGRSFRQSPLSGDDNRIAWDDNRIAQDDTMLTMRVAAWACLAIAMVTAPCRSQGKATPERRATVEAWVTTADKAKLLARTPNVPLASGEQQGIATTIEVDTAITYQEMVGFGAAITDASAWLIQTKLSPSQREALLQELFGRANGIGLSFTRLTIGASDFSRTHYTFDLSL